MLVFRKILRMYLMDDPCFHKKNSITNIWQGPYYASGNTMRAKGLQIKSSQVENMKMLDWKQQIHNMFVIGNNKFTTCLSN